MHSLNTTLEKPVIENNFIEVSHHCDIIHKILDDQSVVSEEMRLMLSQMSIYYQTRLSGKSHEFAIELVKQARSLTFNELGLAQLD